MHFYISFSKLRIHFLVSLYMIGRIRYIALEKKTCLRYMILFFEFGFMASKQNLFSSIAFCQFWATNSVKSEVKRLFYP